MPINMSIEYPKLEKKVMELQRKNAELLDACKEAIKWLCYPTAITETTTKRIRAQVKSAIAKAEGK